MIVNKNITHKEQRQFSIDGFRGVDFASSPVACDPRRSPDAVNFIGDHGINRKRHGWEQCVRTGGEDIKCITQVREDLLIVVSATEISKVKLDPATGRWDFDGTSVSIITTSSVTPVSFNGKMFFIGANQYTTDEINGTQYFVSYYDYDTDAIKSIEEADYYIPTTTIDIDPVGEPDVRAMKDMPNLLTKMRKNTLVGAKVQDEYRMWYLDGYVNVPSLYEKLELIIDGGTVNDGTYTYEEKTDGKIMFTDDIGYIHNYNRLFLLKDTLSQYSNLKTNITITFGAGGSKINPYIGNIGCAFGIDGANDRLFLAGHPGHPNVIFFSEMDNPFYFPDQYTISVGSPNSKIVGMMRLNDGTMAVFKEPSDRDVCLYYIKGSYRNEYDDAGNIKKILPVFSVSASPFYDAPISSHAALGFCGDSIFISKNGIYAIEPEQNISADIRIARNRAAVLSPLLYGKNLTYATGIVYKNKCYFSCAQEDGTNFVLVADAAYKYAAEGELSYNYEWWKLEWDFNVTIGDLRTKLIALTFAIVNDELWFGTNDGRLCRFTDGYMDSIFNRNNPGDISIVESENNKFQIGVAMWGRSNIDNGRRLSFESNLKIEDTGQVLSNRDLYFCNVDKTNRTFQLSYFPYKETTEDFIDGTFVNGSDEIMIRMYHDKPVTATWSTPPLDFGSSSILKSMRAMTVVAESGTNAKFRFGYETGKDLFERNMEGTGKFDFNNLNFADFSFDSGFQNAFTVRSHAHNFNFIRFHIISDEAAPCAVHRISAEYKFNKKNRGVN